VDPIGGRDVPLIDYAALDPDLARRLAGAVAGQTTLERALDWLRSHRPPLHVETIFTQDEFTHDVLVPFEAGRYLVYDTT
jgi:hypothetical protein